MIFHTAIPKSWSQKRLKSVLGKPDPRRPDLDNYIKLYLDVMNDLVYEDDKQVTEIYCKKVYSNKPRVEIKLTLIEN
jgi:Holliday junction resolvase RusA-like endonuclease